MLEVKNVRKLYDNKNGIQKANFALKERRVMRFIRKKWKWENNITKMYTWLM